MSGLLIKNGRIVTDSAVFDGDILIGDGKIRAVEAGLERPGPDTGIIDAAGLYVLPGGIDPHVHMALPLASGIESADDFESGTTAALAGGTTSIIDFVTPGRSQSLIEALDERKALAQKSLCDYGLHMSITAWNETIAAEMERCVEGEGITSFKVYLAYKETIGLEDRELISAMAAAARLKVLITAHCEHGDVVGYLQEKYIRQGRTGPEYHPLSRPPEVEREAVCRALLLAKATNCPLYVVHVSTAEAAAEIERAREAGQQVLAETCPHYLLLDESRYRLPGFEAARYVMSPPLRANAHLAALWKACARGVIQVVATDHCPFHFKGQKEMGRGDFTRIPNGVAGVENRLSLLYTYGVLEDKISLRQFVDLTATGPARIFGLYPRKGTIRPGADADLVLWDPHQQDTISAKTHHQHCDTNIYEGFPIKGKPHLVISNGKPAYQEGRLLLKPGSGHYLPRKRGNFPLDFC